MIDLKVKLSRNLLKAGRNDPNLNDIAELIPEVLFLQ